MINDFKISAMSLTGKSVGWHLSTLTLALTVFSRFPFSTFWNRQPFFYSFHLTCVWVRDKAGLLPMPGLMLDNFKCFASASMIRIVRFWHSAKRSEHPQHTHTQIRKKKIERKISLKSRSIRHRHNLFQFRLLKILFKSDSLSDSSMRTYNLCVRVSSSENKIFI